MWTHVAMIVHRGPPSTIAAHQQRISSSVGVASYGHLAVPEPRALGAVDGRESPRLGVGDGQLPSPVSLLEPAADRALLEPIAIVPGHSAAELGSAASS